MATSLAVAGCGDAASGDFDTTAWKAAHGSTSRDNPRSGIVGDVMEWLRPGRARAEVVEKLGPPEIEEGSRMTYNPGASTYGIDYEYLVLEMDKAQKLVSFAISRG